MKLKFLRRAFMACLALGWMFCAPASHAGGSIDWERVQAEITKEDPFIADFIAKHFDVAENGGAARVGHDQNGNSTVPGVEVGTRLPPYQFRAKPKGQEGDYTLLLILEPTNYGEPYSGDKKTSWKITLRQVIDKQDPPAHNR